MPDHVRSEIHSKVERFKARRRAQTLPLPFEEPVLPDSGNVVAFPTLEPEAPARPSSTKAAREAADRATRLLLYLGDVIVNGRTDVGTAVSPTRTLPTPVAPMPRVPQGAPPAGTRQRLQALGPERFAEWVRNERRVLVTDTTMRDAHQSLFATRLRSSDMQAIAPYYAHMLPHLFSMECWGGATFDVAMRFLKEDPWERLAELREGVPNILFQMLLRASNAVGYTNYADNVVRHFVAQAAAGGIDLFRVFDSLNWVENMRVAIDAVRETGALCEGAICYTGDPFDPARAKYSLSYYVSMAKELERAGVNIIGPVALDTSLQARDTKWITRVNRPMSEKELATIRHSIRRGTPLGLKDWASQTAEKLGLESSLRPQGRPRKQEK